MFKFLKNNGRVLDFNKEILMGEIGAVIGAQMSSFLFSIFTSSPKIISLSAVIGSLSFASLFFLGTRIYDYKKRNILSTKRTIQDIGYYTPVAFCLILFIYQPILFFSSKYLLQENINVSFAVFLSQILAFMSFLIFINLYRLFLKKFFKVIL